jgi:hypothetical protein
MYREIRKLRPIHESFSEKMVQEGVVTKEELDNKINYWNEFFRKEHEKGKSGDFDSPDLDHFK